MGRAAGTLDEEEVRRGERGGCITRSRGGNDERRQLTEVVW